MQYFKQLFVAAVLAATQAFAGVTVIVNSNAPISALKPDQLAAIFLKKNTVVSGYTLSPVDQNANTMSYTSFYRAIMQWSSDRVATYWSQQEFTGAMNPPEQLDDNQAVLAYVAHHAHAIGYVDATTALNHHVSAVWTNVNSDTTSVWHELIEGYQLTPINQQHTSQIAYAYKFWQQQTALVAWFTSAQQLLPYVLTLVKQQHMPTELALLPMLESHYQMAAKSQVNAQGLWQLMPATAKAFSVTMSPWFDGRLDVKASTQAALALLNQLYQHYQSWPLALAAYNAGMDTVDTAINSNEQKGLPTDYWHLTLPKETEQYVPKLLALAQWVQRHQDQLPDISMQPKFVTYRLQQQVPVATLAELTQQTPAQFLRLNAGLKRIVTPDHAVDIYIPKTKQAMFAAGITAADNSGMTWRLYKAKHEDWPALSLITHNTVAELRQLNPHLHGVESVTGWLLYQVSPEQQTDASDEPVLKQLHATVKTSKMINQHDSLKTLLDKLYRDH